MLRRAEWLARALTSLNEPPRIQQDAERVWLHFTGVRRADHFHRALLAENVTAELHGSRVALEVAPWFTPADVRSLALAVAKVAYYLGDGSASSRALSQ